MAAVWGLLMSWWMVATVSCGFVVDFGLWVVD